MVPQEEEEEEEEEEAPSPLLLLLLGSSLVVDRPSAGFREPHAAGFPVWTIRRGCGAWSLKC